ncbi:beta-amyrin 11-oxidase-like [Tripterygium wilfordii]|uniref:beta-amyrin 11-oxidase-like n=1 Tax=Tripterygium wilfordii TaxID=458696 RepID=UPI0018F84966|nr:beta-amyrin 11-oxidase-like [Tripterygium wilfordii]
MADILELVLVTAVAAYYVIWFLKRANEWYFCSNKKNLPPGDMGWPVLGNMIPFLKAFKSANPAPFHDDLIKRYGKTGIYKSHLFGSPIIIVSQADLSKAILTDDKNFGLSYPNMKELLGKRSISNLDGDEHKRLRRLTTAPINGVKALSGYIELIEQVFMASLDEMASMNKPVELFSELKLAGFKVATNIFFGPQGYSVLEPLTKLFGYITTACLARKINIPGFPYYKALKARHKMVEIVDATIEDRKVKIKNMESHEEKKCMLDLLLELESEDGEKMDNETMIDLLSVLVFGGHESTAVITMWLMIHLHDNPEILQKVKEEQEYIIAKRPPTQQGLTMSEIKEMVYTAKVIQEVLRLSTLGVGAFRYSKADVEMNGYTIPKGWKILVMYKVVQMDPENFPNPKSFDPSRWDDHNKNLKAGTYTPFGLGSRICPGNELAKTKLIVFLHCFLPHYKLERINPKCRVVSFPNPRPTDNYLVKITKLPK